tara:strand:+ start:25838 stop:26671 length:834 start_codon:yes stop_codon:yes gene_type:complete
MKKIIFFGSLVITAFSWAPKAYSQDKDTNSKSPAIGSNHEDPDGYYTCPMHPQVHEHKAGKCPICGMPLVKTAGKKQEAKKESIEDSEISVTNTQLSLAGIGKYTVTRKELIFSVPVSGRMISSRDIAFQVFESDLQVVKNGLEFTGSPSSSPDKKLKGQIRSVDSMLDPSSRTIRVIGTLSQTPKRFVLEGSFDGEIQSKEKNQITVPEDAVLHTGKGSLVYVFTSDNNLKPVSVTLGKRASSKEYQILSGLNEGDVISTGPNFLIDSEAKIRGAH